MTSEKVLKNITFGANGNIWTIDLLSYIDVPSGLQSSCMCVCVCVCVGGGGGGEGVRVFCLC